MRTPPFGLDALAEANGHPPGMLYLDPKRVDRMGYAKVSDGHMIRRIRMKSVRLLGDEKILVGHIDGDSLSYWTLKPR